MERTERVTVRISDLVDGVIWFSSEDGTKVGDAIRAALDRGCAVDVSFAGCKVLLHLFTTTAIWPLYDGRYSDAFLAERLTFVDLSINVKAILDLSIEKCRRYYAHREALETCNGPLSRSTTVSDGTPDIRQFFADLPLWFSHRVSVRMAGDWMVVTLPYLDHHYDCIEIFVRRDDKGYFMSDDGAARNAAIEAGCDFDIPEDLAAFKVVVESLGCQYQDGSVCAHPGSHLVEAIHNLVLLQTIVPDAWLHHSQPRLKLMPASASNAAGVASSSDAGMRWPPIDNRPETSAERRRRRQRLAREARALGERGGLLGPALLGMLLGVVLGVLAYAWHLGAQMRAHQMPQTTAVSR